MKRRTLISLLAAAPVSSVLTACGGGSSDSDASMRLVNASAGYPSLDLYVDDDIEASNVAFGTASDFSNVSGGDITTTLTRNGSTTSLLEQSRNLDGENYTIVAYGWVGELKSFLITEDEDEADSNETKVNVLNVALDAGELDVYLTGEDDLLEEATPVASGVGTTPTAYSSVASGTYRLRVTGEGDTTDLRLDVSGVTLSSEDVVTIVVTPGPSGVLVNAITLVQGGAVTSFANTSARVRVVAAVTDFGVVSATANGAAIGETATANTIGAYALVTAGTAVPVTVTVNGVTTSSTQAFVAGTDYTLLVYGEASSPLTSVLTDDNRLPSDSSTFKIRMIHALSGINAALTLKLGASSAVSNVAYGTSSSFVAKTPLTADVTVISPLSGTPIYLSEDVVFAAQGIYTVFMMGSASVAEPYGEVFQEEAL